MLLFIFGLLCIALFIIFWVLQRTYQHVPPKELKRMARGGDELALLLYKPVAYGLSLQLLLSLLMLLSFVGALGLLTSVVGIWLAVLVMILLIAVGAVVLVPSSELTRTSLWLAARAAPAIAWLLERVQPVFGLVARLVRRHRPLHIHTGLYEKGDLAELLEKQKAQPDNRIEVGEIDLLAHALTFGDKLVTDTVVPKRVVKAVSAEEAIGPVLMTDLHQSGHSRFPVYDPSDHDKIIGVLYLHDLVANTKTGTVRSLMHTHLSYVHEDFTLYQTLQAFLKTKQHLFVVVNSFEEYVGIITIEDVLEQIIGRQIVDEFDQYDDLRAVASAAAHKEHQAHQKAKEEPVATVEAPEVIK